MYNDIKKGFGFNLGRIISRLFIGFIILFLLFCFNAIRSKALSVGDSPNAIYANLLNGNTESYNIYNNTMFYEPRDSGNIIPYFNRNSYDDNFSDFDPLNAPTHYYGVDTLTYRFNGQNTPKTITISYYFYGYIFNNGSFVLQNQNNNFVPSELWSSTIDTPRKVDYQTTNGMKASNLRLVSSSYVGNGGWKYTYKFDMYASNGYVWLNQTFSSNNRNVAYTGGITIDNVENWNGVIDTQALIDNDNANTQAIINNANNNHKSLIGKIGDIINIITNGFTNLPSLIWSFFSGGFSSIINGIGGLPSLIWSFFSGAITDISSYLSSIFGGIATILSDETPTSQWIANYINNFPGINDNLVAQIITLPIHILSALLTSNQCTPVSLGILYGYNLTIPCLGSIITGLLGSLVNILTWIITFYIYYLMFMKLKDLIMRMLTLESNVARDFKIKF